jgi:hypothetical protein
MPVCPVCKLTHRVFTAEFPVLKGEPEFIRERPGTAGEKSSFPGHAETFTEVENG